MHPPNAGFFSGCPGVVVCLVFASALLCNTAVASIPAVYVLGDSLADVGNNNHLRPSLIRPDFPHNGVDYWGHQATGRFSNGKNFPDFIAGHLGLITSPPFLSIRDNSLYLSGVNFASGGAGVSSSTSMDQCISFDKQIEHYSTVHASLVQKLSYLKASDHLARSIFTNTIGSNDILDYARLTGVVSRVTNPTHQQFIHFIHTYISTVLDRPVAGCTTLEHASFYSSANMSYTFFDTFRTLIQYIQQPATYGFVEVRAACCGLGDLNATVGCTPVSTCCANRTSHVFWDCTSDGGHSAETISDWAGRIGTVRLSDKCEAAHCYMSHAL